MTIPVTELRFTFSRSGGPGGQNVNKVASKVTIHWDYCNSEALTQAQKETIANDPMLSARINKKGEIVIQEDRSRDQIRNKEMAIIKLEGMVDIALEPRAKRIPTKLSRRKKAKRLDSKAQDSRKKATRRERYDLE